MRDGISLSRSQADAVKRGTLVNGGANGGTVDLFSVLSTERETDEASYDTLIRRTFCLSLSQAGTTIECAAR